MRILLLAGTSEARKIAQHLSTNDQDQVIASLAGATRAPDPLGVETRIGGFGGKTGFANTLQDQKIDVVIDATHPFAAQMTKTAAEVCNELEMPHVIVQRAPWQAGPQDKWHVINHASQAQTLIARGKTVFLATGRQTLQDFENLKGRVLLARVIDPPTKPFPFEGGEFVVGRPPFSIEDEIALFQLLGVDWLVVKNSGGNASRSKLDAAAKMGLPVAMIARPDLPNAPVVDTVQACLDWIETCR